MCTHVKFVNFGFNQVISEDRHVFLWVKFIFTRVFAWGYKDKSLIGSLELLNAISTFENSLFQLVDSVMLLFRLFNMFAGNGNKRLCQHMEIEENLVPRFFGMYVICRQV